MTMTEVDQNEVKKEENIDIDKRILAWSNISKIFQTTFDTLTTGTRFCSDPANTSA